MKHHIIGLEAKNVLRIKAVKLELNDTNFVLVSGRNDQGKTSFLRLIELAISGEKALGEKEIALRRGSGNGYIILKTNRFVITREWESPNSPSVIVVRPLDGNTPYSSPDKLLNALKTDLTFDPLEFYHMKSEQQIEIILKLGKFKKDPQKIDAQIKYAYDMRRDVNRELKHLKGMLEKLPEPEANLPDEPISIINLSAEKDRCYKTINDNRKRREEHSGLIASKAAVESQIKSIKEEIESYDNKLKTLNALLANKVASLENWDKAITVENNIINKLIDPDPSEIDRKIYEAQEINKKIESKKSYTALQNMVDDKYNETEKYNLEIEELRAEKAKVMSEGELPVKGLTYEDNVLYHNGLPLSQESDSEKINISFEIAKALNPNLQVIVTKEGDKLDKDKLETIVKKASEDGYQIWIERIHSDGLPAVVIEDGTIQ